jgi:hypothetical protein
MLAGGRAEDAERTFKRASELLPGRAEPLVGLARCHAAASRRDESLRLADEAWQRGDGAEASLGELLLLFEQLGDGDRVARLLVDRDDAISDESIEQVFRFRAAAGGADAKSPSSPCRRLGAGRSVRPLHASSSASRASRTAASALEQLVETRSGETAGPLPVPSSASYARTRPRV